MKQTPIDKAIMTAFPHNIPQKKTEASAIRNSLRLRITEKGEKQIYTTIHGSGVFRWFTIDDSTFEWYRKNFVLTVELPLPPASDYKSLTF